MRRLAPASATLTARSGFSLMEIIIATAILMGSVVVLARLAGLGRSMAQKTDLLSNAHRICERTLNEIAIGERPLQTVERAVLEPVGRVETNREQPSRDDSIRLKSSQNRWLHTVTMTPLEQMPELVRVTVTVEPDTSPEHIVQSVESDTQPRRERFTLSRWLRTESSSGSGDSGSLQSAGGIQ